MPKIKDLTGKKFGKLAVLEFIGISKHVAKWLCRCECGNITVVTCGSLRNGHTQSCGCLRDEKTIEHNTTHGLSDHPLYPVWNDMRKRCKNKNAKRYKDYGGRGIKICEEWGKTPELFIKWAEQNGYKEGLTIDRIDNNSDYCPKNCTFSTMAEQNNNKRNNHLIEYNGETKNINQWAKQLNVKYGTLWCRLEKNNWNMEGVI